MPLAAAFVNGGLGKPLAIILHHVASGRRIVDTIARFSEIFSAFIASKAGGNRRASHLGSLELTGRYWVEFVGDGDIQEITTADVEKFLYDVRVQRELKPNSVHLQFRNIRNFFNWATANDELQHNPVLKVSKPFTEKPQKEFLSKDECIDFLSQLKKRRGYLAQRDYIINALFIHSWVRLGEMASLTIDDIRPKESAIVINGTKGREERYVVIPQEFMTELAQYVRRHRPKTDDDNRAVFLERTGEPFKARGIRVMVCKLQREYIPRKLRKYGPHVYRHTGITLAVGKGSEIRKVQKKAGHKDIETTEDYIHLEKDYFDNFKENPLKR
jgi:site-specific recombinase XerD